jgi:hypothetical protein
VEQSTEQATGFPPPATDDGSFFGIPYGWPLIAAIIVLILVMWMAREPLRRVIWQVFFITGRVFGRWGLWLTDHGRRARTASNEKIAAHRADELQDRMLMLENRMGKRAEKLAKETGPVIARLDKSTHQLATAATDLTDINLEDAAERAFRAALPSMESGRGLNKLEKNIAQSTARAMNDRLVPVRPALSVIKTEAPRLRELAEKLNKTEQEFNQSVDEVNKTFEEFEMIMRSEDRSKIASRASIVIPWFIAILITAIALSGVFLNFFLIERPMAEIVGEGARIGGIGLPTFAAIIVIFLEFVAGVVLMDAAGFTRLIPAFHSMTDGARKIMFWVAFAFLALFSVLEMTLSIVREQIIEQQQETRDLANRALITPTLTPTPDAAAPEASVPETAAPAEASEGLALSTIAQLILAGIIPWLLAAAALPLETIVRNSVFMLSIVGSFLLLMLAFICKTLSVAFKNVGLFALTVYDAIIFAPLWIERRLKGAARNRGSGGGDSSGEADDTLVLDRKPPAPQKEPRRDRDREKSREPELQKA